MSRLPYFHKDPAPCPWCGKEVKRSDQKFCSKSCLVTSTNLNGIKKNLPIIKISCKVCKSEFIAQNQSRARTLPPKYCTAECHHKSMIGLKRSVETRAKYSIAASKRKANKVYTKGIGGIRSDIGHYVRSSWEANIARLLNYLQIGYHFENKIFNLVNDSGNNITYLPDFQIYNRFLEIKGWWTERSLLLKKLMAEQYPNVKITYIDERLYNRLLKRFAAKIPTWEFKIRNQKKASNNTCI